VSVSCINQNLSVMGVASCRSTFLCLMLSVRLVPFRISIRDLITFSGPCTSWDFDPRSGPAQPSPAWPGPARPCAPLAPTTTPPMRPLLSLSHLDLPRNNLPSPSSTSLSPWRPRIWRRRSPDFGPRGELPSPPLLLSLSPSSSSSPARAPLFFLLARAPALPRSPAARPAPPAPCRGGDPAPAPVRGRPRPSLPRAAAPPALARPRGGASPRPCSARAAALARPCPAPRRRSPAPARPAAAIPSAPARWRVASGAASGPGAAPGGSAPARPLPRRGLDPLRASSWPSALPRAPRLPLAHSRVRNPRSLRLFLVGS
jgi:hypothetical protein